MTRFNWHCTFAAKALSAIVPALVVNGLLLAPFALAGDGRPVSPGARETATEIGAAAPIIIARRGGSFGSRPSFTPPRQTMPPSYRGGGGTFSAPRMRPLPQVRMHHQQRIDQARTRHQQAMAQQQQQSQRMAQESARHSELRQRLDIRRREMEEQFRRQREQQMRTAARAAALSAGTLAAVALLAGSPRMALGEPLAVRLHCLTDGPAADDNLRSQAGAPTVVPPGATPPDLAPLCADAGGTSAAPNEAGIEIPQGIRTRISELARNAAN
jgi:hypothetical protein